MADALRLAPAVRNAIDAGAHPSHISVLRMTALERKRLLAQIGSKKVGERRSAVKAMWKSGDQRFAPAILEALKKETLTDPSVWQSKCLMIAALGDLGFRPALTFFKQMTALDFTSAPIVYAELSMAICRLESIQSGHMKAVGEALKSKRPLFAHGAFQAITFLDLALEEAEIIPLIRFANAYSKSHPDDEGLTVMPRDYLAAAAYQWKGKAVQRFLVSCRESKFPHLQKIAEDSLAGIRSSDHRLRWYK